MNLKNLINVMLATTMTFISHVVKAEPPFSGTIFIDPDIITPLDPSAFQAVGEAGRGLRWMFDRRVNDWVYLNAFLFNSSFDDGLSIEVQVNPEFGSAALALVEARKYSEVIGRLPTALRADVATVWIHKGTQPFGGGNHNLLIHTGQADQYSASGILEETFVHEASHTSLDAAHANTPEWLAAQTADPEFISTYARDFPTREDIAESFLPYLAVRYRSERISAALGETINQTIPNRIAYFDNQTFAMHPMVRPQLSITRTVPDTLTISWPSPSTGWNLEQNTTLTSGIWTTPPESIDDNGSTKSITVNTGTGSRFFRLKK